MIQPTGDICHPYSGRKKAMKASILLLAGLALAMSLTAPIHAGKVNTVTPVAVDNSKCSGTSWPTLSSGQCHDRNGYSSYAECQKKATELGWRSTDAWWWCSTLGLK